MYAAFFCYSVATFYYLVKMIKYNEYMEDKVKDVPNKDVLGDLITIPKRYLYPYLFFLLLYPYNHYFMIYPFMMQMVYLFIFGKPLLKRIWIWLLGVAIMWIPAVIYFYKQVSRLEGMWLKQATFKSFFSTIHYFMFHSNTDLRGNIENLIGYVLVFVAFLMIYLYATRIKDDNTEKRRTFFLLLYFLVPIFIGLIVQMFKNVYHHRYYVYLGWAFVILLVRTVWWVWNKPVPKIHRWVTTALGVLLCLVIFYQAAWYIHTTAFELKIMGDHVCNNCYPDYVTLHKSPFSSVPTQYFLRQCGCDMNVTLVSDLTERQFRSAGGDVIEHDWILEYANETKNIGHAWYYRTEENLMPYHEHETILRLEGIHLVHAYPPEKVMEGLIGVKVEVK
jgi:hypothetical protein